MYKYGYLFPLGDDNFVNMSINFNFTFFRNTFSSLILSTNGFAYFSGTKCCYVTQPDMSNLISGFNYDLNTLNGGTIYYQNLFATDSSNGFALVLADLNRLNSTFVPTNVFRITYENVLKYASDTDSTSFQIVLASDAAKSYVLLKYYLCIANELKTPGLYYMNTYGQQLSSLIAVNPCLSTNVNLNGTWVFDVTSVYGIF